MQTEPLLDRLFKNRVSTSQSSVKISDTVQRDDPALIESVFWSAGLDKVFKDNLKKDPELRSVLTPTCRNNHIYDSKNSSSANLNNMATNDHPGQYYQKQELSTCYSCAPHRLIK